MDDDGHENETTDESVSLVYGVVVSVFFFFFSSRRRHTRSLRDWSSDVCSSDLGLATFAQRKLGERGVEIRLGQRLAAATAHEVLLQGGEKIDAHTRSEERRVGKECRSRWSRDH